MEREIFGPVLHIATFDAEKIDRVISDINRKGYGLTFGLHTRIDDRAQHIVDTVHAGNIYVNRNQIGAVVGSQPFGGEGLSGTGPKAGGPNYLRRFRRESESRLTPTPDPSPQREGERGGSATLPRTSPNLVETEVTASPSPLRGGKKGGGTETGSNVPRIGGITLTDTFPADKNGDWVSRNDRVPVLRKLLRGKAAAAMAAVGAFDYGPVDLPGPTGEANTLVLVPRGNVLCLGPGPDALVAQVIQALAAGNRVLAIAPDASKTLQPLLNKDLPLTARDGSIDPSDLVKLPLDLVAFSGDPETLRLLRRTLAARSGPVIGIVSEMLNPAAYAHERSICVDTTAAGGNASLLAAS
jgi:RHH-type proline utilization regulon transcriptional repressor/proline dehydrogenase/delta 1-pyrroline-5-carboxylate dehydrogenase